MAGEAGIGKTSLLRALRARVGGRGGCAVGACAPAVRRLTLRRLSESAVRTLAASTGADAGELSRLTGGNPFLVVEALAAGGGLPSSVRDATLARVGRLDADARGVVDAAAVVGQ